EGAEEWPGRVAEGGRIGTNPHARAVGSLGDGFDPAHFAPLLEGDRHGALVVRQGPPVRPVETPGPAPLAAAKLGVVAPEFRGGAVIKGNAALGVGRVDRDWQSLEQLRLRDHGVWLARFISTECLSSGRQSALASLP